MTRVFVVADIGEGDRGWRHVGDEAMFWANCSRLMAQGVDITACTRGVDPALRSIEQVERIDVWDSYDGVPKACAMALASMAMRWIPAAAKAARTRYSVLTQAIRNSDAVLISGGGNLNSVWPGHLYFRAIVCLAARILAKPVFIAGQTVGPIEGLAPCMALRLVAGSTQTFAVRDRSFSSRSLESCGLASAGVVEVVDDAFAFAELRQTSRRSHLVLGATLSTPYDDNADRTPEILAEALQRADIGDVRVVGVPHEFDANGSADVACLLSFTSKLASDVETGVHTAADLAELCRSRRQRLDEVVRGLTVETDCLITTRYHGAVFAIGACVPTLFVARNAFERNRFQGLIDSTGLHFLGPFIIDLRESTTAAIAASVCELVLHRSELRRRMSAELTAQVSGFRYGSEALIDWVRRRKESRH